MAEPINPRLLSTRETRTLRVPKSTPATMAISSPSPLVPMPVHLPAEIAGDCFVGRARDRGKICRYVVLKTVFADVAQKALELRNFDDARSPKSVERIVGKRTFADISTHDSGCVVGGEAGKAHGTRLHSADTRSESIFFSDCPGDDFLEIHADILKEMLGQIAAVKAHCLVGIISIVIVPIEQRAGTFRAEPEGVHADGAANVDLAGARDQVVTHHAHDGAGHDAEIFFHCRPALHGAYFHIG